MASERRGVGPNGRVPSPKILERNQSVVSQPFFTRLYRKKPSYRFCVNNLIIDICVFARNEQYLFYVASGVAGE